MNKQQQLLAIIRDHQRIRTADLRAFYVMRHGQISNRYFHRAIEALKARGDIQNPKLGVYEA